MDSKMSTQALFREHELDQGFILRANEEVSKHLKHLLQPDAKLTQTLAIKMLAPEKRTFGL